MLLSFGFLASVDFQLSIRKTDSCFYEGRKDPRKMAVETKRRVKVYSFGEKLQWEDMGTGQISMDYVERNQVLTIIVRSEVDGKSVCK